MEGAIEPRVEPSTGHVAGEQEQGMDGGRDDAEGHEQRDVVVEDGADQVRTETGEVESVFHDARGGHGEGEVEREAGMPLALA
jgi:hypothetical protein